MPVSTMEPAEHVNEPEPPGTALLLAERDRIARDLHDTVIQDLFGTALDLASVVRWTEGEARDRVLASIDRLDTITQQLRSAIFGMRTSHRRAATLVDQVMAVVSDASRALGHHPCFRSSGPVNTFSEPDRDENVVAVVREALANVARHARATRVDVELEHRDGHLSLRVVDDGCGMSEVSRAAGHGMSNIAERARSLGGIATIDSQPGPGTTVGWRVPAA